MLWLLTAAHATTIGCVTFQAGGSVPPAGAEDVAVDVPLTVAYRYTCDEGYDEPLSWVLRDDQGDVAQGDAVGAEEVDWDDRLLSIDAELAPDTDYELVLHDAFADLFTLPFHTGPDTYVPPTLPDLVVELQVGQGYEATWGDTVNYRFEAAAQAPGDILVEWRWNGDDLTIRGSDGTESTLVEYARNASGSTVCVEARPRDALGNVGDWTEACAVGTPADVEEDVDAEPAKGCHTAATGATTGLALLGLLALGRRRR